MSNLPSPSEVFDAAVNSPYMPASPYVVGEGAGNSITINGPATVEEPANRGTNPAPAAAPPEPTAPSVDALSFFTTTAAYLQRVGLGELAYTTADGMPAGWLWEQILAGADTGPELTIALEATAQWQREFNVIVEQRRMAANGQPVQVMSVEEVVAYRQTAQQIYRRANLPTFMYDDVHDFDGQMLMGRSVAELNDILGEAWSRTTSVDPAITRAFEDFYGVGQGEAALASYFLNPERTMDALQRQSRAAYAAGMGQRYGIGVNQAQAERIATSPRTEGGIVEGFGQIAEMAGVFSESIGESGEDLTAEETGIGSVFDNDSMATRSIQRRIAARRATRGNPGGAAMSQQGVIGLGRDN